MVKLAGARPHVYTHLEGLWRRAGSDMQRLVSAASVSGMRGSFGRILSLIDAQGSRQTALADGAWITKQSLGERIRELERLGWVTVSRDPEDGRARLVRRTAEGDRVAAVVHRSIASMEAAWAAQVGPERYATFREVMAELGSP